MASYYSTVERFVVVGDRLLLKPKSFSEKTTTGLYLPPGVHEKEKVQSGYVVKTGPGYAVAPSPDADEPWKGTSRGVQYIPLQAREGDLAIYLQSQAYEIEFEQEKYVIVPQSAVLLLIRDDLIDE
jgi:chaperonin GroES